SDLLTLELKPMLHLRRDLQARETDDFSPLGTMQLQRELRPIVDTINQYATRLTAQVNIQKRFIADAAHQLRTPVAIMSTQLDYAAHLTQDPELSETLRAVRASARRQKDLINQLLSLSHAESSRAANLPRKKVSLLDLAQEVLVALSVPADDKEMDLGLSATSADVAIWTFPTLVHAIAFNLVDNAIRYTPHRGRVTVHVGPDEDGGAVLRVDDSGPGIPDSVKARVFERFSRGNMSDNDGFGLGLAIVGEAAKTCGAQIELATPRTGGLSVIVRLPLDES
ncbi:MAG: sensor histidine kinase, partial [Trinickia sp.]